MSILSIIDEQKAYLSLINELKNYVNYFHKKRWIGYIMEEEPKEFWILFKYHTSRHGLKSEDWYMNNIHIGEKFKNCWVDFDIYFEGNLYLYRDYSIIDTIDEHSIQLICEDWGNGG